MTPSARAPSLARLHALDGDDNVIAVIETPRETRTKLAYDGASEAFRVKKVLPEGMSFPFDFGFIPSTLGGDGDPLDILVLMDEPVPTGTIVPSRLIGVIEARQTEEDGETEENDRLIAVANASELFRDVKKLSDLPAVVVEQIEHFFVAYNQEEGKRFDPVGRHGRKRATECLQRGMRRYRRKGRAS
jgi:inorganic pyrophosphatase